MSSMSVLPLDKKEICDGSSNKSLPALHQHWASRSRFVAYVAPPQDSSDQGLMGEWLERLQYICTDLHWLLQLTHQKFWCQVIFDESLHHMLDSFLRYSPRPFDTDSEVTGNNHSLHSEVTRLIFFTYLRMATYKESKENWLTPEVFGEIIYENFLFDVPKLMDLCALYGHANAALLSKMITNVFTQQPKYLDDLRAAVPTILQVLVNMAVRCGLETDASSPTPQKLDAGQQQTGDAMGTLTTEELQDMVLCLADSAITLSSFLTIYPPACAVLQELQFSQRMAHMYDKLIPAFQSAIKQRDFQSDRQKKTLRNKLRQARTHMLTVFHLIVSHTCLQPVLTLISKDNENGGHNTDVNQHMEDFLAVMSAVLGEKRFLADYEGQFNFQDDMDILSQAAGDVDEAHYRYILEAINTAYAAHGKRKKPKGNTNTGGRTSPDGSPCPPSAPSSAHQSAASSTHASGSTYKEDSSQGRAEAAGVTGVELDSLICAVKDLLPHLGTGFIQMAFEELGYNVEHVLSAVLEDKLPPSLLEVDFSLESATTSAAEKAVPQPLMVESRKNIYDNDEFDVFNNPIVDVQRIHKGKKSIDDTLLENKETLMELKPLYEAYGTMDVASMYDPQLYDDEYDDTYDNNNVGADDADSADELNQRRRFTVPQVLRRPEPKAVALEDSSEEEEAAPRDQFVQDPAKLRERQEQRRASQNQKPPQQREVKGKAKGQGQTDEVLRNRRFKEKNKGARSNHNRRAMADKKQSKGMF